MVSGAGEFSVWVSRCVTGHFDMGGVVAPIDVDACVSITAWDPCDVGAADDVAVTASVWGSG